ncbi:uncharacterized protein [Macrobrachium rosenbergii]|uniref:uncharacterized protein n=1 Tax=Macrobrachium rosenbergii TaxID=79674 RepID=UPI0034D570EC
MDEKKRLTLDLARLLPSQMEEKPFYHYRGPVTGQCGPERDWIVFEDPLEVVPSFLSFLKVLNDKDNLNHHFPPVSRNACYLYSHYSEETDGLDCGFSEAVARTVTPGNKSGNSLDSLLGKSKQVRESMAAVNTSDNAPIPTSSSDPTTVEADKDGVFSSKFGDYSTSPQFDSVSTYSLDSRTVMAKIENVGITPKDTTPLLSQSVSSLPVSTKSAEIGEGGITFKETPHPTLPTASSTESAQQPHRTKVKSAVDEERYIPSNETFHTISSLLTSTKLTQELLEPTTIEQPLHSSDNGELGSLSTLIYSVTFEHSSSTVEDDQAETSPQEGIEPELITAPEHYVRERPGGSGASTGRLSELPLFVFLISRILFW